MNYTLDAYVDNRLEEWAKWIIDIDNGNIGYPKLSSLVKIMNPTISTVSGEVSFTFKHAIENQRAEEVDAMIKELKNQYPEYAEAITAFWINRHEDMKLVAEKFNLSRSAFMQRVRSAKLWLSGRFSVLDHRG
jgi:hypothetical protein